VQPGEGLDAVADGLNRLRGGSLPAAWATAWKAAAEIVADLVPDRPPEGSPPGQRAVSIITGPNVTARNWLKMRWHVTWPGRAARLFRALAREASVRLSLVAVRARADDGGPRGDVGLQIEPTIIGNDEKGEVVRLLWQYVFTGGGWRQLRRCDHCQRWFVDHSDNRSSRFCQEGNCKEKWWNVRDHRRRYGGLRTGVKRAIRGRHRTY